MHHPLEHPLEHVSRAAVLFVLRLMMHYELFMRPPGCAEGLARLDIKCTE